MLPLWILWAAHSVVEVEDLYADETMHPWMVEAYMLGLKVVTGHKYLVKVQIV